MPCLIYYTKILLILAWLILPAEAEKIVEMIG